MKKSEKLCIVIFIIVFLIAGIVLGGWLFHRNTPQQTRTREEYQTLIEQKTSDQKLQRMFVADDDYIRSLEYLASVFKSGVIMMCVCTSVLAFFNLAVLRKCPVATTTQGLDTKTSKQP